MLKRWQERRQQQAQERLIEDTLDDSFGRPQDRHIKKWTDRELHARLVSNELHPVERSMAERELEKRKAWDAPAGRAFWISCAALAVSALALIVAASR